MLFLTPTAPCTLEWPGDSLELNAFDSVVVPAAMTDVTLVGDAKVLMSSLPNHEHLIAELGYRAENVAGLTD